MKQYKPAEFARLIGRSVATLQRWDREGKLVAYRSETNRRYYLLEQYFDFIGVRANNAYAVAYIRTSCATKTSDETYQQNQIVEYANKHDITIDKTYCDYNSNLNYLRDGFSEMMNQIRFGMISKLIVTHKDRLLRFGYEWFESFCKDHGTEILVLNHHKDIEDDAELLADLKVITTMMLSNNVKHHKLKKDILDLLK